jgi:hypothetical protein
VQTTPTGRKHHSHPFETLQKCLGYRLCDPLDQTIGTVKELFVNADGDPDYIRVELGMFGLKTVLLPVQMVAVDHERRTLVLG